MYGKEYFFGGGLQSMPHDVFVQMHGGERPKEYIDLGFTDISQVPGMTSPTIQYLRSLVYCCVLQQYVRIHVL